MRRPLVRPLVREVLVPARAIRWDQNLIVGGDFADGLGLFGDGSSPGGSITADGQQLNLINATGTSRASYGGVFEPGRKYRLTMDGSGASCALYDSGSNFIGSTSVGANEFVFVASASASSLGLRNFAAGTTAIVDNIELRRAL